MTPAVLSMRDEGVRLAADRGDVVYVGRPTKWGNPYVIGTDGDRDRVIMMYENRLQFMLEADPTLVETFLEPLKGKDLACWCAPEPCHADVLLKYANKE